MTFNNTIDLPVFLRGLLAIIQNMIVIRYLSALYSRHKFLSHGQTPLTVDLRLNNTDRWRNLCRVHCSFERLNTIPKSRT